MEQYVAIRKDKVDPKVMKELNDLLVDTFKLEKGKTYFIKTGIFSNKFDFKTAKVTDIDKIMEQYLDIHYAGLMVGAYTTSEIVIREYIEPVEDVTTIYNGMPLRTEFRVFVDIQGEDSKVLGSANYWHPEEMHKISENYEQIKKLTLEQMNQQLDTIKEFEGNHPSLNRHRDLIHYLLVEKDMEESFNKHKSFVEQEVLTIAKNIKSDTLNGQWSLDVMKNGDDFYVIDAARMHKSALTQYI